MLVLLLKALLLLGGLTALIVGFLMLFFFEKFMALNEYLNRNYLVGEKYDSNRFGLDKWIFAQSYLISLLLLAIGIYLMTVFVAYAPY